MDDNLKESICEYYADCNTVEDVAELYADIKMENQKQMEFMMKHLTREDNE